MMELEIQHSLYSKSLLELILMKFLLAESL